MSSLILFRGKTYVECKIFLPSSPSLFGRGGVGIKLQYLPFIIIFLISLSHSPCRTSSHDKIEPTSPSGKTPRLKPVSGLSLFPCSVRRETSFSPNSSLLSSSFPGLHPRTTDPRSCRSTGHVNFDPRHFPSYRPSSDLQSSTAPLLLVPKTDSTLPFRNLLNSFPYLY